MIYSSVYSFHRPYTFEALHANMFREIHREYLFDRCSYHYDIKYFLLGAVPILSIYLQVCAKNIPMTIFNSLCRIQ
jgi:hypothetical protein